MRDFYYSVGNHKVGKDTMILNIRAECMSRKLGMCQLPDCRFCYDMKSQMRYPQVKPYRRNQEAQWCGQSAENYADKILDYRTSAIEYVRMQEGGDFKNQGDFDKLNEVAKMLNGAVRMYVYTARKDLNYDRRCDNLVVNGSGFMVDNEYRVVSEFSGTANYHCIGGCLGCFACKGKNGWVIETLLRR